MKVRAEVLIFGIVQGVSFRAFLKEKAERLSITGWARNTWSGELQAVFEGDEEDVERMLVFCNEGPSAARVDDVQVEWKGYTGEFKGFAIQK